MANQAKANKEKLLIKSLNVNVDSLLRKYEYNPELSDGILNKYEEKLFRYLGQEKYIEFSELRQFHGPEELITNYIGSDIKLLKLVFSSQIKISKTILENILEKLKKLKPTINSILELGGADAWALDYLSKSYISANRLINLEKNPIWKNKNEQIHQVNKDYIDYQSENKFDLIFSILGAPISNITALLNCVKNNLDDNGICIVGIRIPNENQFIELIENLSDFGLSINKSLSNRISVNNEKLTVLCLKKTQIIYNSNDKLRISRMVFHGYSDRKRIYGFEANCLYRIIKDGKLIKSETKNFDVGWMKFDLIQKSEINYLYVQNYFGDCHIQFPVDDDFDLNNELFVCNEDNFFTNSL